MSRSIVVDGGKASRIASVVIFVNDANFSSNISITRLAVTWPAHCRYFFYCFLHRLLYHCLHFVNLLVHSPKLLQGLWGERGERSVMAASMSSAVMALLGVDVEVGVEAEEH